MAAPEVDLSTIVYCDKLWIQFNGGWLHSNNVLFYFAQSPFFDRLSSNNTVITQNSGIPERELRYLSTKNKFQEELTRYAGIQYVVDQDPMENEVFVDGPNGKERSMIWVIKKLDRKRARSNDMEVLGYYYIIDDTIYQAPNMFKILEYRLMNACLAVDKVVNTTMNLPPYFSVTNGYSYFRPGQKSSTTTTGADAGQSRLGTPLPGGSAAADSMQDRAPAGEIDTQEASESTVRQALNLTLRYYDQYDDDTPLIGEPGNFRYAKSKNPVQNLKASDAASKSAAPSKTGTPVPSQAASAEPSAPFANGSSNSTTAIDPLKRKRRKSKPVNELS